MKKLSSYTKWYWSLSIEERKAFNIKRAKKYKLTQARYYLSNQKALKKYNEEWQKSPSGIISTRKSSLAYRNRNREYCIEYERQKRIKNNL